MLALLLAILSLGAEVPLGTPALRPAIGNQTLLGVASNGRDFLALWNDTRVAGPTHRPVLYAGRVDAAGHAVEPNGGHQIADAEDGRLIWDGSRYLLIYFPNIGAPTLQPLDDDGNAAGPSTKMDLGAPARAFATNGRNFLTVQLQGQVWLNALDGSVIWKEFIGQPTDVSDVDVLPNGDYRFVALAQRRVTLVTVDGTTGFLKESRTLAANADHMAAAFGNGRVFVAWTEGTLAKAEIVDVTTPAQFATGADGAAVSAGWDGHQFAVALATPDALRIARINAGGSVLDVVPDGPTRNVRFARSATDVLMAGDVFNGMDFDVVARASQSFDDLAAAQQRAIATSASAQVRPRVADGGLTFWHEDDALMAQQPGGTPAIAGPNVDIGVGHGASSDLVVWVAGSLLDPRIVAKRVAFDGTPIGRDPIVLADSKDSLPSLPAVAYDGTNFLVVWGDNLGELHAVRVAQDGRVLDAQPIALTNFGFHNTSAGATHVVWSGTNFVVAWLDTTYQLSAISPAPPVPVRVEIMSVSAAGQPLAPPAVMQEGYGLNGVGLAANGSGVELVWGARCIERLSLHNDGTPAGTIRELACVGTSFDLGLAWDGREYVSVWSDGNVVKGLRLDADAEPFLVSALASQPSIAASAAGATIAYVRLATEPPYGAAPRVFTRTIDVRGVPPRVRAAR